MIKCLVILGIVLFTFSSCETSEMLENNESALPSDSLSYLALGDSYTIGQGISEEGRWPVQLVAQLNEESYPLRPAQIIAQTGWRTSDLILAIESQAPESTDIVSLLIGVNDQYGSTSFESFQTGFIELIDISVTLTGDSSRVFVVSIPDYGVTPFGASNSEIIAKEIDMYNQFIAEHCADSGIVFIDITGVSRDLGDGPGALASDNLHPSAMQYAAWVDVIKPVVLGLID